MKKSTRLYHMIHYMNEVHHFTLSDLMEEFNISKSTALRDMRDLEELGVPFYSESGQHGGYHIIRERGLTKIDLTPQELLALLFAFGSISQLPTIPFNATYDGIYRKIISHSSTEQKAEINRFLGKFQYFNKSGQATIPHFEQMVQASFSQQICMIHYQGRSLASPYSVVGFLFKNSKWYAVVLEIQTDRVRLFSMEKIEDVELKDDVTDAGGVTLENFTHYMSQGDMEIVVQCTEKGLSDLTSYLWSNQKVINQEGRIIFTSSIHPRDIPFIAKLLTRSGREVKVLSPPELIEAVKEELALSLAQYQ
ncbi:helix-turn-helix transcriptional regulator [Rossellomorea marisflavi]|uniref:helix-turn-helix transcriptional regulator n=1 Tax=Rossellomorea marisflavi TaxID=189381 RepID=UPI003D2F1A75